MADRRARHDHRPDRRAGQPGQAIARRLAGFEAQIVYHDTRPSDAGTEQQLSMSYRSLEQAAEARDVLVAALPLTSRTRHLISSAGSGPLLEIVAYERYVPTPVVHGLIPGQGL
jgi:hypothetical protein